MTHVLAVEDSPTQAEVLRADLEDGGFTVTLAHSGGDALRLLADARSFDLVVSDVVMPGMDGYQLCKAVKDEPATRHLPVVLLTSLTDPLDVVHGLEAGADNFIRKPYQAQQLVSRLMTTLHNRELRTSGRMQMGIELSFLDRHFTITAERQQILDLLISTFEELVVTSREIREREEELARANSLVAEQLDVAEIERNRLQGVLDAVPMAMVVVDADGRISHASNAAAVLFETSVEELHGRTPADAATFVDVDGKPLSPQARPLRQALESGGTSTLGSSFDVFLLRSDGTRMPVLLQASPFYDERGGPAGAIGAAQVLGGLALVDPVTGLPGNTAFAARVADILAVPGGEAAVLILAIDRFDLARMASGADAGDRLRAAMGRRLRACLDELRAARSSRDHMLAYLGGDQFGVVVGGAGDHLDTYRLAEGLRTALTEAGTDEGGDDIGLIASVGVAVGSAPTDAGQLLAAVGAALRRAREAGGGRIEMFDPAASREALDRMQLELDLRQAVERGELLLHYQPAIDLLTGRLVGFEALARWQHERLGYIPPDVFVSIAEESDLIVTMGRYLLGTACRQVRAWEAVGLCTDGVHVAVNLSAVQLRPELVEEVRSVIEETGIDAGRLVLEVTETAAMADPETTAAVLDAIRRLGVRFALDDFGTGYSSLAYLNRLRFDQLKLDRTFVAGMLEGGPDAAIAQSVIALGHSLGVQVLAEGVETEEQVQALRDLGCDLAQGYHFARPLTPLAAAELLPGRQWASAPQ